MRRVQTDSALVQPLQQVSFDTGSQLDLGDDRLVLELLSRDYLISSSSLKGSRKISREQEICNR